MPGTCVVGLQWGDEAKGKIVDLLGDGFDLVVRYNGGANAGHTVVVNGKSFKLSLLPTGVIRPNVTSVIGNGVVVYPPRFLEEVDQLAKGGIDVSGALFLSDHAHVIFPYHMEEERLLESGSEGKIGTTGRGIGPCYAEKVHRSAAIRIPYVPNPKGRRIEVRFPDPTTNPYLAFSAMLMAGLDGVQNKIHPGDPVDKNLYDLEPEEAAKVPHPCASLDEALEHL